MSRRRSPRPLATAVEGLAARLRPATPLAAVQAAWGPAVGERIAAETEPVREHHGEVTIRCSSAVWAQEIELMGPSLVAALNRGLEAGVGGGTGPRVTGLRCTAAPGHRRG
jgi:predicted nucleic acid-binding Zn ribbon protein